MSYYDIYCTIKIHIVFHQCDFNIYTFCTFIEGKVVASVLIARDDEVASWVRPSELAGA